jgi:hypothetical protein
MGKGLPVGFRPSRAMKSKHRLFTDDLRLFSREVGR